MAFMMPTREWRTAKGWPTGQPGSRNFGLAGDLEEIPLLDKLGRKILLQVELGPDRVDGAGVRGPQFERHFRGIRETPIDKNACGGTGPDSPNDLGPDVGCGKFLVVIHHSIHAGNSCRRGGARE